MERGRVGVRCIHCTKARNVMGAELIGRMGPYNDDDLMMISSSSSSSISSRLTLPIASAFYYPNSILHLSSTYLSKFQSHLLNTCPNISDASKIQLLTLLEENNNHKFSGNVSDTRKGSGGNPNEMSGLSLSHTMYNVITARRIGLVDVTDRGIRFSRDLQCQPLPFTNVRYRVEHETNMGATLTQAESDTTVGGGTTADSRMTADAASEAVLAEAVTERDDPDDSRLCRVEDKAMLSDFIFLGMRQMSLCRATMADLTAKWKKSKRLQIGFAGFCCRWCNAPNMKPNATTTTPLKQPAPPIESLSARFFPSAADHLTSAIGSSFVGHLQKCQSVPSRLHHALATYKRLHVRHMTQLPYGSQRRMYQIFWSRLRAADMIEVGIETSTPSSSLVGSDEYVVDDEQGSIDEMPLDDTFDASENETNSSSLLNSNEDTKAIVNDAEENWDPSTNDGLILPTDRHLVSDYLFLMMRQLKKARMDDADVVRLRKNSKANSPGLACIHCFNRETHGVTPSGRAFPSAPDNFHAALNTSLYNHMQVCLHLNHRLKQALMDTRKYHSTQCASLKFGSQRKFFNILFERLSIAAPMDGRELEADDNTETEPLELSQYGFMQIAMPDPTKSFTMCTNCRMVPIQFRSPDSFFVGPISAEVIKRHSSTCHKTSLNLTATVDALDEIVRVDFGNDINVLKKESFVDVIRAALVHEILVSIFTKNVTRLVFKQRGFESNDDNDDQMDSNMMPPNAWQLFPTTVEFDTVNKAIQIFANEIGHVSDQTDKDFPNFLQFLLMISPGLHSPKKLDEPNE